MSHDLHCCTILVPSFDGTNESRPFLLHRFGAQLEKTTSHDPYSLTILVPSLENTDSQHFLLQRFGTQFGKQ